MTLPAGAIGQRRIESRPDVLVSTNEPLREPIEVTGKVKVVLWAPSHAPDTDFVAKLCNVYPDRRSINICEGILRARFREGFTRQNLMKSGTPYRFEIDLRSTHIVFNREHRIRVHITSSNAPAFDPNPNTGEPFGASEHTSPAHNTIYMDAKRSSHVLLPVVRR